MGLGFEACGVETWAYGMRFEVSGGKDDSE